MIRIVADLGNSRLKWGRLGANGQLDQKIALPLDDSCAWTLAWERWNPSGTEPSIWAIASVNPPLAERLNAFLQAQQCAETTWYRSAADVPVTHTLENAETAGADRALGVAAARALHPAGRPGLVVSCGTALVIERINADGIWQGGAIAPGLSLSARVLHQLTAQLPLISPVDDPPPWGRSTRPAMEAGIHWGTVGAVRELLTRQAIGLSPTPWLVWTGGDAQRLAPFIEWSDSQIVPDLVLEGLARVAFDDRPGH